jgi:hypothetical protein
VRRARDACSHRLQKAPCLVGPERSARARFAQSGRKNTTNPFAARIAITICISGLPSCVRPDDTSTADEDGGSQALSENSWSQTVLSVFIHAEPVQARRTQHGLFAPLHLKRKARNASRAYTTILWTGERRLALPSEHVLRNRMVMRAFLPPRTESTEAKTRRVWFENRRSAYVICKALLRNSSGVLQRD